MIIGIGTDIVYLPRIKKVLERFGERFCKKIFKPKELRNLTCEEIGGKFSAKESFVKALGTGFRGISFYDLEILNDNKGKPYVMVSKKIREKFFNNEDIRIHLSISHEKDYAISFIVLEKL